MAFDDPIVAGTTLIRSAIQSPTYSPNQSGWTINADGSAEFNKLVARGGLWVPGNLLIGTPDRAGRAITFGGSAPTTDSPNTAAVELLYLNGDGSVVPAIPGRLKIRKGGGYSPAGTSPQLVTTGVEVVELARIAATGPSLAAGAAGTPAGTTPTIAETEFKEVRGSKVVNTDAAGAFTVPYGYTFQGGVVDVHATPGDTAGNLGQVVTNVYGNASFGGIARTPAGALVASAVIRVNYTATGW
jgi:hypothetical protein